MKKILIGGAFDLIHIGHVMILKKAKSLGDYLIVNVSSDITVKSRKGVSRPIIPAEERAGIISELRCVDKVVLYKDELKANHFRAVIEEKPDVLCINRDEYRYWQSLEVFCKEHNVELIDIGRSHPVSVLSTTKIIEKIKLNC